MSEHALMQIAQQAILVDPEGRVLLLRRPDGNWQFAGGRLEEGESWDEGLRREVEEETGITAIDIGPALLVATWEYMGVPLYGTYFYCLTNSTEVQISREHEEYRWVSSDDNLDKIQFWHSDIRNMTEAALRIAGTQNRR
jgi:8-oxo-dGTP diphosphatase